MQAGLLSGWRQGSLAKSNIHICQAPLQSWDKENRGVGRRKDAEVRKLCQKRNERRNGKQDSAAS